MFADVTTSPVTAPLVLSPARITQIDSGRSSTAMVKAVGAAQASPVSPLYLLDCWRLMRDGVYVARAM
eukprot:1095225-Prymnesium_polylepis.1